MTKVKQIESIVATSTALSDDGMKVNIEYTDHNARPCTLECSRRDFECFLYVEGELRMADQQHAIDAERWFHVYGNLDRNAAATIYLQRKARLLLAPDDMWPASHPIKQFSEADFERLELRNRSKGTGYSFTGQNY